MCLVLYSGNINFFSFGDKKQEIEIEYKSILNI